MYPDRIIHLRNPDTSLLRAMSPLSTGNALTLALLSGDIARSKLVSGFLKWMIRSGYIPRFYREMELGANYLLERGLLVTYVGWHMEDRSFEQEIDLQQIAQISPEIFQTIEQGENDEELILLLSLIHISEPTRPY